ncbi:MAG: response regulator transcription factor [Caldilineaceae bacterium]|nr:response regulator transcription factor [Caldilineaceae bacterium]
MRILLADHHDTARWAIRTWFEDEPDFELVGEAMDCKSALKLAEEEAAELVLVDSDLPGGFIGDLIATCTPCGRNRWCSS